MGMFLHRTRPETRRKPGFISAQKEGGRLDRKGLATVYHTGVTGSSVAAISLPMEKIDYDRLSDQGQKIYNQFIRVLMSQEDWQMAVDLADILLGRDAPITKTDKQTEYGLQIAMVVSYCRPFKPGGRNFPKLPEEFQVSMSTTEKTLHDRLEQIRDQIMAHSDLGPRDFQHDIPKAGSWAPVFTVANNVHTPLTKDEVQQVRDLARRMDQIGARQHVDLQAQLVSHSQ